jgi:hypothetical protein
MSIEREVITTVHETIRYRVEDAPAEGYICMVGGKITLGKIMLDDNRDSSSLHINIETVGDLHLLIKIATALLEELERDEETKS